MRPSQEGPRPEGQQLGQGRSREKCLPERKLKVYSQDQAVMTSQRQCIHQHTQAQETGAHK